MNLVVRFATVLAACLLQTLLFAAQARAADKVTFGLDWVAEPEYGGYYQALATGIYKKYGLDVTIVEGGPEVNNAELLVAGRLTFDITSNSFLALNFAGRYPLRCGCRRVSEGPGYSDGPSRRRR
jgi:NitT/TauT family transport system substrate-binding protein